MENVPPKMLYKNLPPDYKKPFSTSIKLLKLVGIDIFGPKLGFSNVNAYIRLLIYNIFFVPFTLLQIRLLFFIGEKESFLDGAGIIPTVIILLMDSIKMPAALLKKDEIKDLFLEIGELWPKGLVPGERRNVFKSCQKKNNILYKSFFYYISVNLLTFQYIPLLATGYYHLNGSNEYLFPFKSPGLWTINSTSVYLATYLWDTLSSLPSQLCVFHAYDLLIILNTLNISTLFHVLQVDLKDAIKASCATRNNTSVSDEDYAKIKNVVVTHQKLFSLVDKLNDSFGLVVFTHIVMTSMLIGLFCFMTVAYKELSRTINHVFSAINIGSTIFLLSLAGQLLCDTSAGVADAAYNSVWYDSDPKVKRLVLLVIIRSQRPCYLSALNYSTITLTSFSKICSSAWTYLSLLTQMFERT